MRWERFFSVRMMMEERIRQIFKESASVKMQTLEQNQAQIKDAVALITETIGRGNKVLICGNGGSAADSQHMAAEFIGRFQKERQALPAIALSTDTSVLTSLSNDYSFEIVFSRQIEGLGRAGDALIAISTSGHSPNVIKAIEAAKKKGMRTISLVGHRGGEMAALTDLSIIVPSTITARIQEAQGCIIHCICELVENNFS